MKNPTDPEELANIFNKKHKEHMDDPLFHLIRSNTLKPTLYMLIILITLLISDQHVNVSSYMGRHSKVKTPANTLDKNMGIMGSG